MGPTRERVRRWREGCRGVGWGDEASGEPRKVGRVHVTYSRPPFLPLTFGPEGLRLVTEWRVRVNRERRSPT